MKGQQERYIRLYNPVTNEDKEIMEMPACSHLMSNFDGTLYIGDGTGSPVDVIDTSGYKIENDPWLYILAPKTKTAHKLVKHNSTWRVLYSCDAQDEPALYLTKVPGNILEEM